MSNAVEAVRAYLRHTGGDTLAGIWNGLRRQYSQAEIRKALRELAPDPLKVGDWSKFLPDGSRVPVRTIRGRDDNILRMGTADYPEPFTLYRLPAEATRG